MAEIQKRTPNTVTETFEAGGRVVETVKTFKLGTWEAWKIQQGLAALPEGDDKNAMAFFEWLIGSCPDVEITIVAKYGA
jgi:hypothetical protein